MHGILQSALKGDYAINGSDTEMHPIVSSSNVPQQSSARLSDADQGLIEQKTLKPLAGHQTLTKALKWNGCLELISFVMVFVNGATYGWTSTPFWVALGIYLILYYIDVAGANYINNALLSALENNHEYLSEHNDELDDQFNEVYQLLQSTFKFNQKMNKVSLIPGISLITGTTMAINLVIKAIKLGKIIDSHIDTIVNQGSNQNKQFQQLCDDVKNDPVIKHTLILIAAQDNPYSHQSINDAVVAMTFAKLPQHLQTAVRSQLAFSQGYNSVRST